LQGMRTIDKQMLIGALVLGAIVLMGMQWQRNAHTASVNSCVGQAYLSGEKMKGVYDRCND